MDANENDKYRTFIGMLEENGMDQNLLKSEPVRRRKRYKKLKTSADFYSKGFEDLAKSDDSSDQYSTVFRRHQHVSDRCHFLKTPSMFLPVSLRLLPGC